jgi:hypothetical protein
MAAAKKQELDLWGRQLLVDLVEKNTTGTPAQRTARAIEVLEYCVPPLGPTPTPYEIRIGVVTTPEEAECLTHRAFRTLFKHYRDSRQTDKAQALAPHYAQYLKAGLGIAHEMPAAVAQIKVQLPPEAAEAMAKQMGGSPETIKKTEAELKEVEAFLAAGARAAK